MGTSHCSYMFFLTSALNLASAHVPVDQPLLFRFVTALLWLLAVARDWPVSDFIHASCWPALLDFKTEKMSKKNGCIASGGHPIPKKEGLPIVVFSRRKVIEDMFLFVEEH